MNPIENLYYGIGEVVYAIAAADGEIQKEEREKLHQIVTECFYKMHDGASDLTEIIFKVLSKDELDSPTAYEFGIHQLKLNSHYLSPEMKTCFKNLIRQVAEAYPPVTVDERDILEHFNEEIDKLHGDPVFYKNPS